MIRAIVADDEELALDSLLHLLKHESDFTIINTCSNGIEAFKACSAAKPDVVFLDIQMPGLNGLEVAELITEFNILIVFITAFDEYAVQAFETHAIDYLLKPVNRQRLEQCLIRVRERLKEQVQIDFANSLKNLKPLQIQRIAVKEKNKVHIIELNEIIFFEAQGDYAAIFSAKGLFLKKETLAYLEKALPQEKFLRVHRSLIVNMDFLERIENNNTAILKNGKKIPVSRSGYKKIFEE